MQRRQIIRSLLFGTATAKAIITRADEFPVVADELPTDTEHSFTSKWHLYQNMLWTGEDLWAQRLQDFEIKNGAIVCNTHGPNRTVHILTHQLSGEAKAFTAELKFQFLQKSENETTADDMAGFRLGLRGRFPDYRAAILTMSGVDIGLTRNGKLIIGKSVCTSIISAAALSKPVRLQLICTPLPGGQHLRLKAYDDAGNLLATHNADAIPAASLSGNIALLSHFKTAPHNEEAASVQFMKCTLGGAQLTYNPQNTYGAIYFAQYTVSNKVLKLTAQLAPAEAASNQVELHLKQDNVWKKVATTSVHPLARIANFRVDNIDNTRAHPYKVVYALPLNNGKHKQFEYTGTISAEPQQDNVKALGFSCNWDLGFPDNEVVENASKHKADVAFFLGDQFYEGNGGFGVQMQPLNKACLDYLRKWVMFGWSYRDLFRHIPMLALPDDHDVYHGNIWGSGGRATNPLFGGAKSQDSGGYKMLPEWVNMAQLTQTSHMPDPVDPRTVQQGIGVYYTQWNYGGISFAIVEDRKFKTAPKDILPDEAAVFNGYAENSNYDESKVKAAEAQLLGERQTQFLQQWKHAQHNAAFNVLVSASPFCCLQTLPEGSKNDQHTPELVVPLKGDYIKGDLPTRDMDSNGWPQNRRNEALELLGNHVSLHLVGDQHLPAVVQYGVNNYADSCFSFAVPSLNNLWPRRWWPPVNEEHQPLRGKALYTGNFKDGFGNKMTVHAVASPHKSNREPALLYDRVTGYGVVEFHKQSKRITLNCWPRYIHPLQQPNMQYEGWPLTIEVDERGATSIDA